MAPVEPFNVNPVGNEGEMEKEDTVPPDTLGAKIEILVPVYIVKVLWEYWKVIIEGVFEGVLEEVFVPPVLVGLLLTVVWFELLLPVAAIRNDPVTLERLLISKGDLSAFKQCNRKYIKNIVDKEINFFKEFSSIDELCYKKNLLRTLHFCKN